MDAVDALLSATPETPSYMIGIAENKITRIPLVEAVKLVSLPPPTLIQILILDYEKTQAVAIAIEAKDFAKAMSLRDPEFAESFNNFLVSSMLSKDNVLPVPKAGQWSKMLYISVTHALSSEA